VGCLQRLVRRYPRDAELRDFLAVPPLLDRWIIRHVRPETLTVDLCRLDLLGDRLDSVPVLEFNASSPGGVIFTGMVNRFWRQSSLGPLLAERGVTEAPFEGAEWFADWLLRYGRVRGVPEDDDRPVGLLHPRVSNKREFDEMREQLRRRGRTVVELQPDDPRVGDLRLAYLKYIPLEPDEVAGWDAFCEQVTGGELVVPNALAERWVAENKGDRRDTNERGNELPKLLVRRCCRRVHDRARQLRGAGRRSCRS
jgi:hypothetical protein